jgi:hypothetical protein
MRTTALLLFNLHNNMLNSLLRYKLCVVWTHSGDRLDCKVKVELKVLYMQGVGGWYPPLLVLIWKGYIACSEQTCTCDTTSLPPTPAAHSTSSGAVSSLSSPAPGPSSTSTCLSSEIVATMTGSEILNGCSKAFGGMHNGCLPS